MIIKKVLITDGIAEVCPKILRGAGIQVDIKTGLSRDVIVSEIKNYDALIVRSQTKVSKKSIL